MKVCVLGDVHGEKFDLPEAELYLGIGDLSSLGEAPERKRNEFNVAIRSDLDAMERFFRSRGEREFLESISKTYEDLYRWLDRLGKPVHLISGNREVVMALIIREFQPQLRDPYEVAEGFSNITYIDNRTVEFKHTTIHGIPFVPSNEPYVELFSRIPSFKKRFESMRKVKVPGNPDVILSHSPPRGILDSSSVVGYTGSLEVLRVLKEKRPRYLFCGHVHEDKGVRRIGDTIVVNLGVTYGLFDL